MQQQQQTPTHTLNDPISGDRAEETIKALHDHRSRLVIKEVVEEHLNSTDFAAKVKGIVLETLEADPARNKLKAWVNGLINTEMTSDTTRMRLNDQIDVRVKAELDERGWKKKNLYIPVVVAIILGVVSGLIAWFAVTEAQKANQINQQLLELTKKQGNTPQ